jgi:hypothetical protein
VRSTLAQLRKLILGETWVLPLGVLAAFAIALLVRALVPDETWSDFGGFVLLALVVVALIAALAPAHRVRER